MRPLSWILAVAFGVLATAQTPAQPGGNSNGSQNGSSNAGSNSSNLQGGFGSNGAAIRGFRSSSMDGSTHRGTQGDAISGRVILSDGGLPGPDITIQRLCGTSVTGEAHPDGEGRFTLPLASKGVLLSDAEPPVDGNGCEVHASLAGYATAKAPLGSGHSIPGGDVLLTLRALSSTRPMTVSASTLLAPKEARKAYQKGLAAMQHNSPDQAQKSFSEAVHIDPRYAAAWVELGKVYEQRGHRGEARDAYERAIAADSGYLAPCVRLYLMDVHEQRWQEAADMSSKVLRLNPYEFGEAFYLNAVANLELNRLDAAEHSARESAKLEGSKAEPRANFLLGLILWRRGDLDGAADKLQAFLGEPYITGLPEQASARKMLGEIEQQLERRIARQASGN